MAVALRSSTSTSYGSATNTVLAAPAGLANNDILLAVVLVGASGTAPTVTPPTGFTALSGSPTSVSDTSGFNVRVNVFWKRAASESGSYTFSHSTCSTQGYLAAISGAVASGSPIDASSNNTGLGQSSTALGITTTVAGDLLFFFAQQWDGGTPSDPTGFTRDFFATLLYAGWEAGVASGATGNVVQTTNGNATSTAQWAAWLVGIKAPAGTTYNQTVTVGCISSTMMGRGVGKALLISSLTAVASARAVSKALTVSSVTATSASRQIAKMLGVGSISATTSTRSAGITLSAACLSATAMSRNIAKAIELGCASATVALASRAYLVLIEVATSTSTAVSRSVEKGIALASITTTGVQRAISKTVHVSSITLTKVIAVARHVAGQITDRIVSVSGQSRSVSPGQQSRIVTAKED